MSNYKCRKCGTSANSKCVQSRNIFEYDDMGPVALVRTLTTFDFETTKDIPKDPENPDSQAFIQRELTIGFTVNGSEMDDGADLYRAIQILRRLTPEQCKQALCRHEWRIVSGTCMFGCCVVETSGENDYDHPSQA